MRNLFFKSLLLIFALVLTIQLRAQDVASITGTVMDTTGAVIPGVSVVLQSTATNVRYKAETNSLGSYTIPSVNPGPGYKITFSRDGFKPEVITDLYMNVNATRTQNAKLVVGTSSETVEVSAAAESVTLDTTDATVGNNFEVQFVQDLPVEDRSNPTALFYQQPGGTLDGAVTGARVDQTNVTLDGLDVNEEATGNFGTIIGDAPVDSVQEFRGVTAGPLSSSGQGGGGQFELVTRSGTNTFHGALAEYHRDTDLEANDWFNNNNSPAVPRPPLIRNQFGGNVGGPIWKNKAFFFFDWNSRRDTLSFVEDRTVPLGDSTTGYKAGLVSYQNAQGSVVQLTAAQQNALDPAGIGFNPAIVDLFQKRYPQANDLSGDVGDLINTAGFRFNAPAPLTLNDFVQRVDYTLNDKMKVFGRGTFTRLNRTYDAVQFPGDPPTFLEIDHSYAWVGGHTWTISSTKVNQASYGETVQDIAFDKVYNPQGSYVFAFSPINSFLSAPYYPGNNTQIRTYAIPVVRDDFSWQKGRHSFSFGGTFKWPTPDEFLAENYSFPSVGATGNTYFAALSPSQRPPDIAGGGYTTVFDSAFSTGLGTYADISTNFDFNNKGAVLPQGAGTTLNYKNYETELYFGDTWKLTPDLTISYGVRYQNYTVTYEKNGQESIANLSFNQYWADRVAQSQQGNQGDSVLPFFQYRYGGKANNAPGFYQPQNKNFAPRVAFAYSPSFDKKTVISGGAGIVYDHTIVNALEFVQFQAGYLFEGNNENLFGTPGNVTQTLINAPRFAGIDSPPSLPSAPSVTVPVTPYVYNGFPYGLQYGEYNILIDPNLKIPYSIQYDFGFQHEFPKGLLFKTSYVGRLGRRLLAESDASQLLEFPDNTGQSTQTMSQAMARMTTQLRQLTPQVGLVGAILSLGPQPWFEDMLPGYAGFQTNNQGVSFANNTQAIAYAQYPYPERGDFADTIQGIATTGFLPSNVGMASQFGINSIWTNQGFSDYNGMLVTLHKNAGYGLQFDLNYTWSHSIDNLSLPANSIAGSGGYGFVCDIARPRVCRGNSDFDVTNELNGNFIYDLPFGRGKAIGTSVPRLLDEAIGGWKISGLPTWHTGNAYQAFSNAYVAGFANNAPATLIGSIANLKTHINGGKGAALFAFSDPTAALNSYTGPTGFAVGTRNNLRGPGFFNIDLGLGKTFPIWEDRVNLKFRADAFNATNHPNFATPANDITEANGVQFGTVSSTVSSPGSDQSARVLQLALRLEF